jgi:hypothetical protein
MFLSLLAQQVLYLTDQVGRDLSVYRQAVRTYRPGFRAWLDEPSRHPRAQAQRIYEWYEEGAIGFQRWLINQALAHSVDGIEREQNLPAFNSVRQIAAQTEREALKNAGGSDTQMLELFQQDNAQLRYELREQKEYYEGLLGAAFSEREEALQDANLIKAQALTRLHRIRLLEDRIDKSTAHSTSNIPDSLNEFQEWCNEHLVGSVELVNRAYQGVRKSEYHDHTLLYRALLLLRDFYVPMRVGDTTERRDAYQKSLQDLGIMFKTRVEARHERICPAE